MKKLKCRNYGHRGFSGCYPENTMIAFKKAVEEAHCEGMEFDVHFSKDREIVIIHDELLDRTTSGTGYVKDYTLEELKKLDASYKFSDKVGFCEIPTLREYFDYIRDKDILTNIELKTGVFEYEGLEQAVYDMIMEYGLKDNIVISSFNHYSVLRMKAIDPTIKCGFLSETWILDADSYCKAHDIECYHPEKSMFPPHILKGLKEKGIEINTWTVNSEEDIRNCIACEVEGIIGNFPDRTAALLREAGLR